MQYKTVSGSPQRQRVVDCFQTLSMGKEIVVVRDRISPEVPCCMIRFFHEDHFEAEKPINLRCGSMGDWIGV